MSPVATTARREELHRRGLALEWFTVAWNVVEGVVAIGAALTHWAEKSPDPASKITVGLPWPTQFMCKL